MAYVLRLLAAIFMAASTAQAQSPQLSLPLDCQMGQDCYIQQYVDHDPGPGAQDFTCAGLSYDDHKGTDFALVSLDQMRRGVTAMAAAPGRIKALRDGVPDRIYKPEHDAELNGRDCGNGVLIDHGDGWTTQYCHMAQGSVRVTKGQPVNRGTPLGRIGLSGRTQFPHLHVTLRHNGTVVDPFSPEARTTCDAGQTTLWVDPIPYVPGGLLSLGFATQIPSFAAVKEGSADQAITANAPALVLWALAFGGRAGDSIRLEITGPNGQIVQHSDTLTKTQAQYFRAAGRRLKSDQWGAGTYTGTAILLRAGQELSRRSQSFTLK